VRWRLPYPAQFPFRNLAQAFLKEKLIMLNRMSTLLAATAVVASAGAAGAQPYDHDRNGPNPYSDSDQSHAAFGSGYNYGYDDGNARRGRDDRFRSDVYRHQARYERGTYFYGSDCNGNAVAGTIVGAVAGGAIGNQFGHGSDRAAATVGGVILGGLAGNAIASNMNCNDRRYALTSYRDGFEGRIGHRYTWRNDNSRNYGSFIPTREYARNGNTCRDFTEAGTDNGHAYNRRGTACRWDDGNWHLE
jgi:surface antigen